MQALPAAAVCRCDMPQGTSCCGPEPVPEDSQGCCSTAPEAIAYTGPACHKGIVDADASEAALPSGPPALEEHAAAPAAIVQSAETSARAGHRALDSARRGSPPGSSAPPAYLLHASLLI